MKLFEEYLEDGIVKVQSPDFSRAKSLRYEAEESYEILQQFKSWYEQTRNQVAEVKKQHFNNKGQLLPALEWGQEPKQDWLDKVEEEYRQIQREEEEENTEESEG